MPTRNTVTSGLSSLVWSGGSIDAKPSSGPVLDKGALPRPSPGPGHGGGAPAPQGSRRCRPKPHTLRLGANVLSGMAVLWAAVHYLSPQGLLHPGDPRAVRSASLLSAGAPAWSLRLKPHSAQPLANQAASAQVVVAVSANATIRLRDVASLPAAAAAPLLGNDTQVSPGAAGVVQAAGMTALQSPQAGKTHLEERLGELALPACAARATVSIVTPALGSDVVHSKMDDYFSSVALQSMPPKEVVVVLSEADTAICRKMVDMAKRTLPRSVKFIAKCTYARMNQAAARNMAWRLTTADVVIFLDADDALHQQKVEISSLIFSENPELQTLTHSWTRNETAFVGSLFSPGLLEQLRREPSQCGGLSATAALATSNGLSESSLSMMWGDTMAGWAVRSAGKCERFDVRCYIIHGMVPGAGVARRSALQVVPMVDCKDRAAVLLRKDGGCQAEDSKWMRSMLKAFPARQHHLYLKLGLIWYTPSGRWKWPAIVRDQTALDWSSGYTLEAGVERQLAAWWEGALAAGAQLFAAPQGAVAAAAPSALAAAPSAPAAAPLAPAPVAVPPAAPAQQAAPVPGAGALGGSRGSAGGVANSVTTICVSTHFDDCVLSLGGLIAVRAREGKAGRAIVVTVMSAPPPASLLTRYDRITGHVSSMHGWAIRVRENNASLSVFGHGLVTDIGLPFLDRQYRDPGHRQELLEGIADTLLALVRTIPGPIQIFLPFGRKLSVHPDHASVHAAVAQLAGQAPANVEVLLYEDYPYVLRVRKALPGQDMFAPKYQNLLQANLGPLLPRPIVFDAAHLATKRASIVEHRSQMTGAFMLEGLQLLEEWHASRCPPAMRGAGRFCEMAWAVPRGTVA